MANTDRLGQRLSQERRAQGLTQSHLARAAGLERTALSKIEHGHRGVSSVELDRLSRALHRPVGFFFPASAPSLRDLRSRRREVMRIAAKHGAYRVRIFGSVARADAQSGSDIDVLVRMKPERTLLDQAGLLMDLRDLLGRDVDVVTEEALRDRMRDRVLHEAVAL